MILLAGAHQLAAVILSIGFFMAPAMDALSGS